MHRNLIYRTVDAWSGTLDLYSGREKEAHTLLINFHGGGWTENTREHSEPALQPFVETGWSVANVEYRLARTALAPGAVEDARCAVRWLADHSKQYALDPSRFVVMGDSAGGHLALMAGFLPAGSEFDQGCGAKSEARVAAIINYYGICDLEQLVAGKTRRSWAITWLGKRAELLTFAKKLSPLTYVSKGVPPVISIHGDADKDVPYTQSVRLHDALTKAGVANRLFTVRSGGHGYDGFSAAETLKAHRAIEEFLIQRRLWPGSR